MPKSPSTKPKTKRAAKSEAPDEKLVMPPPPPPEAEAAPPQANPYNLPVEYDRLAVVERSTATEHGPILPEEWKEILGWETEKQYQQRMVAAHPDSKPEHWLYGETGPRREDGTNEFQPIHCLNTYGEKAVCWNNAGNRQFDLEWCKALVQTVLYGQWAGPHTVPGGTVNGECVRISRYGRVLSGQHQGTACILADEFLIKARNEEDPAHPRFPAWVGHEHPFIETLVVVGLSEDERVLRTVDYVKPRSVADMLYTMPLFRTRPPVERRDLARMLSAAIDLLWDRTDAKGYATHPELCGFLDRHKTLLKCVEHLFAEDDPRGTESARRISRLRLNTGQCSSLLYLMGCGSQATTDISDDYRNQVPPSESMLDWSLWERAQEFWTLLASGPDFAVLRNAMAKLLDSSPTNPANIGQGGRLPEKMAMLAKAWEVYKDHPDSAGAPFEEADRAPGGVLTLNYTDVDDRGNRLPPGEIKLIDRADFFGIDCPPRAAEHRAGEPPAPTREEIERLTEEARARRAAAAK